MRPCTILFLYGLSSLSFVVRHSASLCVVLLSASDFRALSKFWGHLRFFALDRDMRVEAVQGQSELLCLVT